MELKQYCWFSLISLSCLASIPWISALLPDPVSPCYIEKVNLVELLIRMNHTVQILSQGVEALQCHEKPEVIQVDTFEVCTGSRVAEIHKELVKVTSRFFAHALMQTDPPMTGSLELDKYRLEKLIANLKALQVFNNPAPFSPSWIVVYPFEALVTQFERILSPILITLELSAKSTHSATTTTPKPATVQDEMLDPEKSLEELTHLACSNPSEMSIVLSQIISNRYSSDSDGASNFGTLFNFVESLPSLEHKVIGFAAIYEERKRHDWTLSKFIKLAKKLKRLNETITSSDLNDLSPVASAKLEELTLDLDPLLLIGEKAECYVTNVAYQRPLISTSSNNQSPHFAYLSPDDDFDDHDALQVYPTIEAGQVVFRIRRYVPKFDNGYPFQAFDTNPRPERPLFETKSSERYVVLDYKPQLNQTTWEETTWKLQTSVNVHEKHYRILSTKFDDFMFAHELEDEGWQRVVLGKKSYSNHDYVDGADLWSFDCEPGEYIIEHK